MSYSCNISLINTMLIHGVNIKGKWVRGEWSYIYDFCNFFSKYKIISDKKFLKFSFLQACMIWSVKNMPQVNKILCAFSLFFIFQVNYFLCNFSWQMSSKSFYIVDYSIFSLLKVWEEWFFHFFHAKQKLEIQNIFLIA